MTMQRPRQREGAAPISLTAAGPFTCRMLQQAMPHHSDLARVRRKAADQGCEMRQLAERVFTVRQRLRGWRAMTRIMRWKMGKLHAFGTLEEIEAWLDRDRR